MYVIMMVISLIGAGIGGYFMFLQSTESKAKPNETNSRKMKLPEPRYDGNVSVEQALRERRSIRKYKDDQLTLTDVSQLLWAAQGITSPGMNFRTAPSAGALYPLEVYVIIGDVKDVAKGVYKYNPHAHEIVKVRDEDVRDELTAASRGQDCVREGTIILVFSAVYERTTQKYGERGIKYVYMEVGHAAQNVSMQAVSLNLGTVVVGAFRDDKVKSILNMPDEENPVLIMPVGKI